MCSASPSPADKQLSYPILMLHLRLQYLPAPSGSPQWQCRCHPTIWPGLRSGFLGSSSARFTASLPSGVRVRVRVSVSVRVRVWVRVLLVLPEQTKKEQEWDHSIEPSPDSDSSTNHTRMTLLGAALLHQAAIKHD